MNLHLADGLAGGEHQHLAEIAEQPFQQPLREPRRSAAQHRLLATMLIAHIDADTVLQGHLGHLLTSSLPGMTALGAVRRFAGHFEGVSA